MPKPKVHPERRAVYKEIARRIVSMDRHAKAQGASQNTIGEIERALVTAFLEGCEQSLQWNDEDRVGGLTWIQVPPRARETLASLTFWFSARVGMKNKKPEQIERFQQDGKPRWRVVDGNGRRAERSIANGPVQSLIRLGLIAPSVEASDIFSLTEEGISLCREYWERSDRNDPTLPKMSLR